MFSFFGLSLSLSRFPFAEHYFRANKLLTNRSLRMLGRHKSGRIKKSLNHILEVVFIVKCILPQWHLSFYGKIWVFFISPFHRARRAKAAEKLLSVKNKKSKPKFVHFCARRSDLQILRKTKSSRAGHATLKRHAKSPDRDSREKRSTLKFVLCVLRDKIA